jgi:hypothetical protein
MPRVITRYPHHAIAGFFSIRPQSVSLLSVASPTFRAVHVAVSGIPSIASDAASLSYSELEYGVTSLHDILIQSHCLHPRTATVIIIECSQTCIPQYVTLVVLRSTTLTE